MVVVGDRLHYDDDAGAPAASLLETKILINSVISHAKSGAKFMTLDIKNFYLATPMNKPENMQIPLTSIPEDINTQYKLYATKSLHHTIYSYKSIKACMALSRRPFSPMITWSKT